MSGTARNSRREPAAPLARDPRLHGASHPGCFRGWMVAESLLLCVASSPPPHPQFNDDFEGPHSARGQQLAGASGRAGGIVEFGGGTNLLHSHLGLYVSLLGSPSSDQGAEPFLTFSFHPSPVRSCSKRSVWPDRWSWKRSRRSPEVEVSSLISATALPAWPQTKALQPTVLGWSRAKLPNDKAGSKSWPGTERRFLGGPHGSEHWSRMPMKLKSGSDCFSPLAPGWKHSNQLGGSNLGKCGRCRFQWSFFWGGVSFH